MVRVLHLMGQNPDFQTRYTSDLLARALPNGINITPCTIGPGGTYRNALLAYLTLRKKIGSEFDVVHAWGSTAGLVAAYTGARRIIFTPTELSRSKYAVRVAERKASLQIACATEFERQFFQRQGFAPDRCHVIAPAIEQPSPFPELRRALGFAEDDFILLAPGETTRAAGHHDALWAASILHVLDKRYKMLLWGRGELTLKCVHLADKLHQSTLLTLAQQKLGRQVEFSELLPAADAVLFTPARPGPVLPLAMCMAAGLPIIATPAPWVGMLKDGEPCIQVPRRSARMLAQRVIELREDAALSMRISDTSREVAERAFSMSVFIERYQQLYQGR